MSKNMKRSDDTDVKELIRRLLAVLETSHFVAEPAAVAESWRYPCVIQPLPREKWVTAADKAGQINPANRPATHLVGMSGLTASADLLSPERIAILTSKYWGSAGVQLTVGFMEQIDEDLRDRIISHMNAWSDYGNIEFVYSTTDPQVRITRDSGGFKSYLGTDILGIDPGEPTMWLQGFTMDTEESEFHRVVRHETGHTLGFPHEHTRQEIVDRIDREKAITLFMHTQGWSRQTVIDQVLTPLAQSAIQATADADPDSIMCYALPGSIMKNGQPIPGGTDIDTDDGKFAALMYPKTSSAPAPMRQYF